MEPTFSHLPDLFFSLEPMKHGYFTKLTRIGYRIGYGYSADTPRYVSETYRRNTRILNNKRNPDTHWILPDT